MAGLGAPRFNGDGLQAELTALSIPSDVTIDACGDLVIADAGNFRVRRVDLAEGCTVGLAAVPGTGTSAGSASSWWVVLAIAGAALLGGGVVLARRRQPSPRGIGSPGRQ